MARRRADVLAVLRQRLLSGLHLGVLRPQTQLPTVRELARELGADYEREIVHRDDLVLVDTHVDKS